MTRELVVIKDNTPGAELARLFRSNDVSCLLVCDESRRLTGIVDADDHQLKPEAPTAQVKQPAPREIAPNAFLGAALERFIAERVTMLPVVENNQLCGVLTPTDVVLTMQCSLQLWARATNAVRENAQASERLEDITKSMQQDIRQQETLTKRIHGDVQTAVRTGQLEPLVQGVNELMTTVGRLSNQLRQAREEIRRQREEAADLKEPESDELTGVGSRRELDLVLRRLLAKCAPPEQPLTAVLVAADAYNKLRELQKPQEADEYLRILAQWLASKVESSGFVARYAPDRFVLALPQMRPEDACQWSRRLSEYDGRGTAGGEFLRPRIGIVSARRGEEAPELLARLEAVLQSA
jgi:diguanylate cyclase